MKKIFLLFLLCGCVNVSPTFMGEWTLNKDEGKMTISNCDGNQCEFKLYASQYGHTCDANGVMKITDSNNARYYRIYSDEIINFEEEILFKLLSNSRLDISIGNNTHHSRFCGISAHFNGIWKRD